MSRIGPSSTRLHQAGRPTLFIARNLERVSAPFLEVRVILPAINPVPFIMVSCPRCLNHPGPQCPLPATNERVMSWYSHSPSEIIAYPIWVVDAKKLFGRRQIGRVVRGKVAVMWRSRCDLDDIALVNITAAFPR
jgi:hypothetical protein